ncbi:MAG: glycoside hydrolase family 3 C-terminal domain-containing protein, partial [Lachnospiraceae bacterium]|nr:glycoside hydrolase family 3 C-terminal domain-containing protein [Lachnospiraceae bacterium]
KGYRSQLRSVTLLKNKKKVLPLKEGIKVYIPDRFIKSHMSFVSTPTGDRTVIPAGKRAASEYFKVVDTPEEADAALCFIESPISCGYDPEDRKAGGNGYVPLTLQYRPYQAVSARQHSLAGGDPLEESTDRGYRDKWNSAANEADLDLVEEMRKRMGEKPVVTIVTLKNPPVMAELEPCTDALLVEYGVSPQAVLDVITGRFTPEGLLPIQMPADMETVEKQKEDVAFDMVCYQDEEGHIYDFGFGMNFDGVIADDRINRYRKV